MEYFTLLAPNLGNLACTSLSRCISIQTLNLLQKIRSVFRLHKIFR